MGIEKQVVQLLDKMSCIRNLNNEGIISKKYTY